MDKVATGNVDWELIELAKKDEGVNQVKVLTDYLENKYSGVTVYFNQETGWLIVGPTLLRNKDAEKELRVYLTLINA